MWMCILRTRIEVGWLGLGLAATSVIFVTKTKTRTRIIGLRYQKTCSKLNDTVLRGTDFTT